MYHILDQAHILLICIHKSSVMRVSLVRNKMILSGVLLVLLVRMFLKYTPYLSHLNLYIFCSLKVHLQFPIHGIFYIDFQPSLVSLSHSSFCTFELEKPEGRQPEEYINLRILVPWWWTHLIPPLRRQRWIGFYFVQGQLCLHSDFQDS